MMTSNDGTDEPRARSDYELLDGLSKAIRHCIQNHALQDTSSKSYDRWNYMPGKQAGMAWWDTFAWALSAKKPTCKPTKQSA